MFLVLRALRRDDRDLALALAPTYVGLTGFMADDTLVELSDRDFGALWTPMSHFYAESPGLPQVRLAFGQLAPDQIETGLDRFAALVRHARLRPGG